jgi:AraC-like DNA-binding protein
MNNLLGYISLTGLLLSLVVIFYNRGYNRSNRFLGAYFFFASLYTLGLCVGMYGNSLLLTAVLGPNTLPFYYLIGPLSYLYVRSVVRDNPKLSRVDYLHFALFVIEVIGMIPWYVSSWEHKLSIATIIQSDNWSMPFLQMNLIPAQINFVIRPLQMIIYLSLQWHLIWKYRLTDHPNIPKDQLKTAGRWLIVFMGVNALWFVNTVLLVLHHLQYHTRSTFLAHTQGSLILAGFILIFLIAGLLLFPQILYGLPRISQVSDSGKIDIPRNPATAQTIKEIKPEKEGLKDLITRLPDLQTRLGLLMDQKKLYLDPDFSIHTLSAELRIPIHHLRYYFGQYLDMSFTVYKNRLRVEYVKKLIQYGENEKHSVEGLGHMAGFSSKSNFFSAFKLETGMSPLEYLRDVSKNVDPLS